MISLNKSKTALNKVRCLVFFVAMLGLSFAASAQEAPEVADEIIESASSGAVYYAIAITMSVASLSAAYAVGKIGAAVMGAAAEKPEILGRAIAFVGLGEGIALFGFLVSLFMLFRA